MLDRMYRKTEVCSLLGVSNSTLYRWTSTNSFPLPIQLGPNTVAWKRSDIENFLASKEQDRGGV